MSILVFDGHVLATLNVLGGSNSFDSDGQLVRGCYFKKTSDADQDKPTLELTGSNLVRLENIEQLTRTRLNDPSTRQDVLDKLGDNRYRGSFIYACVDDTTVNFGALLNRMDAAKKERDATMKEAGLPVPEYNPQKIEPKIETDAEGNPVFDPRDANKDRIVTKTEKMEFKKQQQEKKE